MSYTTHVKGFDSFYTSTYETGEKWLKKALEKNGYEVTFLPNHIAAEEFPYTAEELKGYDCVILSDIGANTLLLPAETFTKSIKKPDRTKSDPGLCSGRWIFVDDWWLSYFFWC